MTYWTDRFGRTHGNKPDPTEIFLTDEQKKARKERQDKFFASLRVKLMPPASPTMDFARLVAAVEMIDETTLCMPMRAQVTNDQFQQLVNNRSLVVDCETPPIWGLPLEIADTQHATPRFIYRDEDVQTIADAPKNSTVFYCTDVRKLELICDKLNRHDIRLQHISWLETVSVKTGEAVVLTKSAHASLFKNAGVSK